MATFAQALREGRAVAAASPLVPEHGEADPLVAALPRPLARVALATLPAATGERKLRGDRQRLPRITQLALVASDEALKAADLPYPPERIGLVLATALGSVAGATAFVRGYLSEGAESASPMLFAQATPGVVAGQISLVYQLRGPGCTIQHRDASPLTAVATAARFLHLRRADAVVVIAVDEASIAALHGYGRAGALTEGRMRPYDCARDGFVLADCASAFVLERKADAVARGAAVGALLLAIAESGDSAPRLGWRRDARAAAIAATRAVIGDVERRIDWIAGAGNGTALDLLELDVLGRAFGGAATPPVSSILGATGESPSSAGLRLAAAVTALAQQMIPGTVGLEQPPPAHEASLLRIGRSAVVDRVLVPCLSQGGANVIVAIGRP